MAGSCSIIVGWQHHAVVDSFPEDVTLQGVAIDYTVDNVTWDAVAAEKGEYRHFMQKEIHEQVRSLTETIAGRVDFEEGRILLPDLKLDEKLAKRIEKIFIIACGTAGYAGMVG